MTRRPSRLRPATFLKLLRLAEAMCALGTARLGVKRLGFRKIASRLGQHMVELPHADAPGQADRAKAVSWAIARAAALTPWRSACLEQAIAARLMLRRRRLPSTVYFGVARGDVPDGGVAAGPPEAHAWVRCGSVLVSGGPAVDRYVAVNLYGDAPRLRRSAAS